MKALLKLGALAAVAFFAASAQASALYWQVTEDTGATFQYAQLKVTGGNLSSPTVIDMAAAEGSGPNYVTLTNSELGEYGADGYSFFVEMVNYSGGDLNTPPETVATGATYSYNELVSNGYVATGATTAIAAQSKVAADGFNMGGGAAVPEPSSGLLLLIGGAMLALRRRRQK